MVTDILDWDATLRELVAAAEAHARETHGWEGTT
jgi:hypothetical protein